MNMKMRNKVKGAIYGFAIGDAMGATTEFMTSKQIAETYGKVTNIIGGGWLELYPGEITDDTQMTMCVMSALMRRPENPDEFQRFCENNFIHWVNSNPKDIGSQCARAIQYIMNNQTVPVDENALGNGSLMRAMPLAILNLPKLNIVQGRITHNNRYCSSIILRYTELMQSYLDGHCNNFYTKKYNRLMNPSGHIYNTFNNAVYWSQKNSFEEAIIGAVNHGGDADTIAAITGSLAGAKYGFDNIPKNWVKTLNPDVKEFLEKFVKFAFNCLQI